MKTKEIIEEFIRRKTLPNVSNEYIHNILTAWNNEEWIQISSSKEKTFLGQNKTFWKGFYFGFIFLAGLFDIIYYGALLFW